MSPFAAETQNDEPSTIVTAPAPGAFASVSMFHPGIGSSTSASDLVDSPTIGESGPTRIQR